MPNVYLFEVGQFLDNTGEPLAGGKIQTYSAGTTSPLATYTDSTGNTPAANPVILDSAGRTQLWLTSAAYKFVIQDSSGNTLQTIDGINVSVPVTTIAGITNTGGMTLQQSTAATSLANQSSNAWQIQGNYWNGSASAADTWQLQDVLGSGTNPTSTLTVTHSGSSGTAGIGLNFPLDLGANGLSASTGTFSGEVDVTVGGTKRMVVDNSNYVNVFSRIQPIQPSPTSSFPLGHDLSLEVSGCADLHLKNNPLHITATTSLSIGANASVAVSSTSSFSHETGVAIVIEPGTANEETVANANWSIVDGTHLSITAAKTHTQPYTISQQGSQFWAENSSLVIIAGDPLYSMTQFSDNHGDALFAIPQNGGGTWPNAGAMRFDAAISGGSGTNKNLVVRGNKTASSFIIVDSATGNTTLFSVADSGAASFGGNVQALSGVVQSVFKSVTANPSSTGTFARLASADSIKGRNNANSADINLLVTDSSDVLQVGDTAGVKIAGKVTSYNGVTTAANGIAPVVAVADLTTQSANVANNTIYAVPSTGAGQYRVSASIILTSADAVSSTLPAVQITWTSDDTSAAATVSITATSSANTVGTAAQATWTGHVKASTNIQWDTTGYLSNTASSMKYAVHVRVEFLG